MTQPEKPEHLLRASGVKPAAPVQPLTAVSLPRPYRYALSMILVATATLVGLPLRPYINPTNLVMLYLVAVMLAAVWLGRYPAILASLLSLMAFDLVFVPPYYIFGADDAEYLLTYAGLLAVGLVISTLTARAREQEIAARRRERQTLALYRFSQKLAADNDLGNIASLIVTHTHDTFRHEAAMYMPTGSEPPMAVQAVTAEFQLEPDGTAVSHWVWRHAQPAGRHTDTLAHAEATYLPLITSGHSVGVLAIHFDGDDLPLVGEQQRLLLAFCSQSALALERAKLAEQARRAHLLAETEKLQTALLNSISHDLRTPLASITGVLSSLYDDDALLSAAARRELTFTAWQEARRLNRLVGNLLDMTRLESGALRVVCEPADVQDLVVSALAQMPNRLQARQVNIEIPGTLPLVKADFTLIVQVLANIIDNALKYAPADQPIDILARQDGEEGMVQIWVQDRGPGIPEAELTQIFNRFYRGTVKGVGGTGLGLSIAKGIVEAHNGRIWAENRPGGGVSFIIALASWPIPPV